MAGYLIGVVRLRRAGRRWSRTRLASYLGGVGLLAVIGLSFVAVDDDVLFWTRAVQGIVLLFVAPLLLAGGAPLTLAQRTLSPRLRSALGQVQRSGVARAATHPGAVMTRSRADSFPA